MFHILKKACDSCTEMAEVGNINLGDPRPKMDVVCMVDTNITDNQLNHRKQALDDIIQLCISLNATLHHITVS